MTDLALSAPPAGSAIELLSTAGGGLAAAAETSSTVRWAQRVAIVAQTFDMLIDTPFVPTSFWPLPPGVQLRDFPMPWMKHPRESDEDYLRRRRGAAAAAGAASLWGEGLGLDVPQSLEGIHVIQGRPGLKAELVLSLLLAAKYRVARVERSATRAVIRIAEPGTEDWQEFDFTIEQARKAGFVKDAEHPRGNDKYNTQPEVMLWHRVVTTGARIVAPHVLRGMATDIELEDDDPAGPAREVVVTATVRDANVEPAAARTASDTLRATLAAVPAADSPGHLVGNPETSSRSTADSSPPVGHPEPEPDPDAGRDPVTQAQLSKLSALLGAKFGIGGKGSRAERHRIVAAIVERPLTSSTELTKNEASTAIDVLEGTTKDRLYQVIGQPPATEHEPEPAPAEPTPPAAAEPPIDPWGINP